MSSILVLFSFLLSISFFFYNTKWQQRWNNNIHNKPLLTKHTFGEYKLAFRKIQKGTNECIPIAHWSHKTYALLYTQIRGTPIVYRMSNKLNWKLGKLVFLSYANC